MSDEKTYEFLGSFDLKTAKDLCDLLAKQHIDFELEIDDSPIRNLTPFQAYIGGTYGTGVSANIYVETESFDRCSTLLDTMR